jgi:hypothetical protein
MKEMVPTKPIMALAHDVGLIKNGRCIFKNTIFYLNSINSNFSAVRKEFSMIIERCPELFKGEKQFRVRSAPIEVLGFEWYLLAANFQKEFLSLALIAKPADQFNGHYRIEVE